MRDDLASVPWLGLIEADHQARVVADLRVIDVQPGEVLCRVGRAAVWWLGVIDGLLKMSNDSAEGLPITFTGITSGGWFGEGTLLKNEVYRYNIQALRPSVVAGIPADTFHWLLGRSIAFNRFVMNQLNERLGQFIAAREIDRLTHPDERVAALDGAGVIRVEYGGVRVLDLERLRRYAA
jgi:CRP-like cAMP-binding protein